MNPARRTAAAIALIALVAVVAAVAFSGGSNDVQQPVASSPLETLPAPTTTIAPPDLPDRGLHPEFRAIDGWLQSEVSSLEELRGQVVAVQFWTFGCSNCKNTLPAMQELYENHRAAGFEIVGIHAPEFSYEAEVDNIADAADELGVTWPIVLDTDKRTFHHWQEGPRAHWPRIYLLDRNGHVRYDHIGEGRYAEIDAAVRALLAEDAGSGEGRERLDAEAM
jgi:thiol-disulfide isomerase/thioredoxin